MYYKELTTATQEKKMTEENVVALRWLISSLETRIIDLEAGRLDENLEDLAKNPIPVQYRSLCQELKCVFPNILTMAEYANNAIAASASTVIKDTTSSGSATSGKLSSDQPSSSAPSIPTMNTANTTVTANATNTTLKAVSVDTIRANTALPQQPVIPDQSTPIVEHGTRKRKLSIGDTEEKKGTVKVTEIKLSPEKKKTAGSDETKTAISSSLASKSIGII